MSPEYIWYWLAGAGVAAIFVVSTTWFLMKSGVIRKPTIRPPKNDNK